MQYANEYKWCSISNLSNCNQAPIKQNKKKMFMEETNTNGFKILKFKTMTLPLPYDSTQALERLTDGSRHGNPL